MRKWLLVVGMVMVVALPLSAQEATPADTACPGDLSAIAVSLSADYETPLDALRALTAAREALQAAEIACARAGVILLEPSYTPAEGTFSINYPNGWSVGIFSPSETGGVLFLGNTPVAQRLLQTEQPIVGEGEMALQVLIGTPTQRAEEGLTAILSDFELLLRGLYPDSSVTEYFALDGRDAARMSFRGQAFDGFLVALTLENGRFVAVRGVTSTGNLDALQAVAQAVAVSTR